MNNDIFQYTEEDLILYSDYMEYVREVVDLSKKVPYKTRKKMKDGKTLEKINNIIWCFTNGKYKVTFISFNQWKLMTSRDKKLTELLS